MIRPHLASAFLISAVSLTAAAGAANAADYDGQYQPNARYSNDFADDPADAADRPTQAYRPHRDDDDTGPAYGWRRHEWRSHWRGEWRGQYTRTVEATSSYASDYGPPQEREARARFSAIEAWKAKVATLYGPRFAHWRNALGKDSDCQRYRGKITCTVSARPVPGASRWSWYGQ